MMEIMEGTFWKIKLFSKTCYTREFDGIYDKEEAISMAKSFMVNNDEIHKAEIKKYTVEFKESKKPYKIIKKDIDGIPK